MIYFIGDVGRDLYGNAAESSKATHFWGGCALNAWHAAYTHEPEHRLLSIKGIDSDALPLLVKKEAHNWPTSFELQPIQEILIDDSGERHFGGYHAGALLDFTLGARELELLNAADIIALPLFAQTKELCFEVLTKTASTIKVALDVGTGIDFDQDLSFLKPYLHRLHWVQSSGLVLDFLPPTTHQIITGGAESTLYFFAGKQWEGRPETMSVVDTTGAGDFIFGRSLALVQAGLTPVAALELAMKEVKAILTKLGPNLLE